MPIPVGDGPWGAIWVMSHDENARFDAEDLRLLSSLADFTGAAMQVARMQALAEKRANEAEEAQAGLRQAEERTHEFIATLSHELRSPIAPVISSLEVLSRTEAAGSAASRALEIAQRSARCAACDGGPQTSTDGPDTVGAHRTTRRRRAPHAGAREPAWQFRQILARWQAH